MAGHVAVWGVSFAISVGLSSWFGSIGAPGTRALLGVATAFVCLRLALFVCVGAFGGASALPAEDVINRVAATVVSSVGAAIALAKFQPAGLGAGFALVEGGVAAAATGALGLVPDWAGRVRTWRRSRGANRSAVVGRPEAVLRSLGEGALGGRPLAILVEGTLAAGTRLRGVPVIDLVSFERDLAGGRFDRIVIVPPLSSAMVSWLSSRCRALDVPCARIGELVPSLSAMRETVAHSPAVLLGRDPIASSVDVSETPFARQIDDALRGKRVMVVGAGGILGAEVSREILRRGPAALLLADGSESALAGVEREMIAHAACEVDARLFDPRDGGSVARLFRSFSPDVVLHLGGRRHIALGERHPAETVLENLFGTRTLVDNALAAGATRVVYVSSHSAVNPTSILGATQRGAELYLQAMSLRAPRARLVTVRLPALLGAGGTLLPQLVDQIERGLPITITHPEMERRFLTVPEACRCLLESLALGETGDVIIPDAGQPVRVMEVARRLVERAGLRLGGDVPVQFTGLRRGERLQEQISYPEETVSRSRHPTMFVARGRSVTMNALDDSFDALAEAALSGGESKVVRALCELLSEYRPSAEQEYRLFDETGRRLEETASGSIVLLQGGAAQ